MAMENGELQRLQEQILRKQRLDTLLSRLREERRELEQKVLSLEVEKEIEQKDVDQLEGRSLANYFYRVVGKLDQKLDKEKKEACAAAVKYDAAVRELAAVKEDLRRYQEEEASLRGCEKRYAKLLEEKAAAIKASGTPEAEEVLRLEEEITRLTSEVREIDEAISAGATALGTTERILDRLGSANRWAAWDLLGGDLIADLVKHGRLDEAQELVETLQVELDRFRTELADVTIDARLKVSINGFLRFADYFFDGLFVDWTVLRKIEESLKRVEEVKGEISRVLEHLRNMRADAEKCLTAAQEARERKVKEI